MIIIIVSFLFPIILILVSACSYLYGKIVGWQEAIDVANKKHENE